MPRQKLGHHLEVAAPPAEQGDPEDMAADQETLAALQKADFAGPVWEAFREATYGYGFRVIEKWAREGKLFEECRRRGVLGSTELPVARRLHVDEAHDIAVDILIPAMGAFRRVLGAAVWKPDGGASLRTFFVHQALFHVPAAYWKAVEAQHAERQAISVEQLREGTWFQRGDGLAWSEPEDAAITATTMRELVEGVPTVTRRVIGLDLSGFRHAEIGRRAGLSRSAVSSQLERFYARARVRRLAA